VEPVIVMNAMQEERAAPRARHPGPNKERAITPHAAQPIWATNMLYFCKFLSVVLVPVIIDDAQEPLTILYERVATSFDSNQP
jgi:hypothetical protein